MTVKSIWTIWITYCQCYMSTCCVSCIHFYRPPKFAHVFTGICLSTGGGVRGGSGGHACVVAPGGHAWLLPCFSQGACLVAPHAWLLPGGMHGEGGHVWQRGGMHSELFLCMSTCCVSCIHFILIKSSVFYECSEKCSEHTRYLCM